MSIRAGDILHVGGQNVIDRIQQAGLPNATVPTEVIREVGNNNVVDNIPQEPDFTFQMQSFNVGTELMAFFTGQSGGQASGAFPGAGDAEGTEYRWTDCSFVNIASPWKNPNSGSAGVVDAGYLIPAYYPTKYSLSFGVTDNAQQTAELSGGSYYFAEAAPLEEKFTAAGGKEFVTTHPSVKHRKGGGESEEIVNVFGVLIDGDVQVEGEDYEVTGGDGSPATIKFADAPVNGSDIRVAYFTTDERSYPDPVHASTQVLPGAVRGRNIVIEVNEQKVGGGQTFTMDASVEGEVQRELGTEEIIGYVVKGFACSGTFTVRPKDQASFFKLMTLLTGVSGDEVYGWFNDHTVKLDVKIQNPKNPAKILKTVRIGDAKFQPPGENAQVNSATDFAVSYSSVEGTFSEFKGAAPA